MRAIIQGKTYNTETAEVVAEGFFNDHPDQNSETITRLYKDKSFVYFCVDTITSFYNSEQKVANKWEVVGNAQKAAEYCDINGLTIIGELEGMPPEATAA